MNKNVLIAWICWWWWVQNEWNDCLSCPASASGKVWPCCEEGGGRNGGPWHQVWRLCVLHPTCGHLPVAHLPDYWCQVCTHGRSAEKGKHTLLNGDVTHLSPFTVSIWIVFIVLPMWSITELLRNEKCPSFTSVASYFKGLSESIFNTLIDLKVEVSEKWSWSSVIWANPEVLWSL